MDWRTEASNSNRMLLGRVGSHYDVCLYNVKKIIVNVEQGYTDD